MLITILVFLAILAVLVFVHELGHFLTAKWRGVKVEEFAFGFKPRLWSRQVGETLYAVNLLPLGGYVKLAGEDDGQVGPRSLLAKTVAERVLIMAGGVLMNVIFAWIILTALLAVGFQPLFPGSANDPFIKQTGTIDIVSISANSPAALAGLKSGDQIVELNGQKMATTTEFISDTSALTGQKITLEVKRAGALQELALTPRANPPVGQGAIGLTLESGGQVKTSWYLAPLAGIYEIGRLIGLTVAGIWSFLATLLVHHQVSKNVTGIVGVGVLTGIARRLGFSYLAQLVMLISLGLAVVNLLPILPLDGGQIAALVYEKVAGKPLSEKQLGVLVTVGMSIVLLIFVLVTYQDFVRFNILGRF